MSFRQRKPVIPLTAFWLLLILVPIAYFVSKNPSKTEAAWFDDTFAYRQTVPITNAGAAQTDFQVSITLNTNALVAAGKMQADCDDIRITDINGKLLPHWIETGTNTSAGTCTGSAGQAWKDGATGKYNSSLEFDGTDDYVSVPYNDAFKFGTGDFTISWWANHTALSGLDTYYENGYYYAGFLIRHQGEMGVYIQYTTGSDYYGFPWVPTLGQWYHLTLRRQAGNLNFYVDGVQISTTRSSTQNIQPSTPTFIAHSAHTSEQFFNGKLDDFRVYNYALTPTQIKTLYNQGSAIQFAPLTGSPTP